MSSSAWCFHTENSCVKTPFSLCWIVMVLVMVTQTERWDYVVFCFFFSIWPRCCLFSVYANSCHTKKSHINSKRHNKLLLWDYLTEFLPSLLNDYIFVTVCYKDATVEGALAPLLQGLLHAAVLSAQRIRAGSDRSGELWVQRLINHSLLLNKDIR